jgi:hypothetical protein
MSKPKVRIIQCAYGEAYEKLLALTQKHHNKLYGANVMCFHVRFGGLYNPPRSPHWDKVHWLRCYIHEANDGDIIGAWDCDLIGLREIDFVALMEGADFAAIRNAWGVFNTGMQLWRVNQATRDTIDAIDQQGPMPPPAADWEQDVIDQYVTRRLKCKVLPANYNDYRSAVGYDSKLPTFIRGYHGEEESIAALSIARDLESYNAKANKPPIRNKNAS